MISKLYYILDFNILCIHHLHANEWITTPLLMKFLEALSKAYVNNLRIGGANARELFDNVSLYIVPMLNPDRCKFSNWKLKPKFVCLY